MSEGETLSDKGTLPQKENLSEKESLSEKSISLVGGTQNCYLAVAKITGHGPIEKGSDYQRTFFYYGSGVYVAEQGVFGIVLTNWHVVSATEGLVRVDFPTFSSEGAVILLDEVWDLAAIVIRRPDFLPVPITRGVPQIGEYLWVSGYGEVQGLNSFRMAAGRLRGYIKPGKATDKLPEETMVIGAAVRSGDSGGPILNEWGEVAGILWGSDSVITTGSFSLRIQAFLTQAQFEMMNYMEPVNRFFEKAQKKSLAKKCGTPEISASQALQSSGILPICQREVYGNSKQLQKFYEQFQKTPDWFDERPTSSEKLFSSDFLSGIPDGYSRGQTPKQALSVPLRFFSDNLSASRINPGTNSSECDHSEKEMTGINYSQRINPSEERRVTAAVFPSQFSFGKSNAKIGEKKNRLPMEMSLQSRLSSQYQGELTSRIPDDRPVFWEDNHSENNHLSLEKDVDFVSNPEVGSRGFSEGEKRLKPILPFQNLNKNQLLQSQNSTDQILEQNSGQNSNQVSKQTESGFAVGIVPYTAASKTQIPKLPPYPAIESPFLLALRRTELINMAQGKTIPPRTVSLRMPTSENEQQNSVDNHSQALNSSGSESNASSSNQGTIGHPNDETQLQTAQNASDSFSSETGYHRLENLPEGKISSSSESGDSQKVMSPENGDFSTLSSDTENNNSIQLEKNPQYLAMNDSASNDLPSDGSVKDSSTSQPLPKTTEENSTSESEKNSESSSKLSNMSSTDPANWEQKLQKLLDRLPFIIKVNYLKLGIVILFLLLILYHAMKMLVVSEEPIQKTKSSQNNSKK